MGTKTMSGGARIYLSTNSYLYKKDLISLKKSSLKIVLPLPLNDTINSRKYTMLNDIDFFRN